MPRPVPSRSRPARCRRPRPPPADDPAAWRPLLWVLIALSLPLIAENLLHIGVGLTDTYLANRLTPAAAAAIGPVTYVTWFLGLTTGAVGTGSTALISRAVGARDRRTARSAVGQSILLAVAVGVVLSAVLIASAEPLSKLFGLSDPEAQRHIAEYLRILGFGVPLATSTFIGNACLRGAGDTVTPAVAMIVIDVVNIALSFSLCFGFGPIPALRLRRHRLGHERGLRRRRVRRAGRPVPRQGQERPEALRPPPPPRVEDDPAASSRSACPARSRG